MRLAKVVGNVVSTVKDPSFNGYKLMIVAFLDEPDKRLIAFDAAEAGIGDTVLVTTDGGASSMVLNDDYVVADVVICGVVDHYTLNKERNKCE